MTEQLAYRENVEIQDLKEMLVCHVSNSLIT